jgi:hypothetical protein
VPATSTSTWRAGHVTDGRCSSDRAPSADSRSAARRRVGASGRSFDALFVVGSDDDRWEHASEAERASGAWSAPRRPVPRSRGGLARSASRRSSTPSWGPGRGVGRPSPRDAGPSTRRRGLPDGRRPAVTARAHAGVVGPRGVGATHAEPARSRDLSGSRRQEGRGHRLAARPPGDHDVRRTKDARSAARDPSIPSRCASVAASTIPASETLRSLAERLYAVRSPSWWMMTTGRSDLPDAAPELPS